MTNALSHRFITVRRFLLGPLLLLALPLAGCAVPLLGAAPDPVACRTDLVQATTALARNGDPVSTRALNAVFARLDAQPRVEVRQVSCEVSSVALRAIRPHRMQILISLNRGTVGGHPTMTPDATDTQIGNTLGYVRYKYAAPWPGVGAMAYRLLLPPAWHGVTVRRGVPSLYWVQPPQIPVSDVSVRTSMHGARRVFVERWRGWLNGCYFSACPIPDTRPRFLPRYTAVLQADAQSGLPVSLNMIDQFPETVHGRFMWSPPRPISQTEFHYSGDFSIHFVKG